MKNWEKPRVEIVDFGDTGFGIQNKEIPDSEKTFNRDAQCWEQLFGEKS
jgi:hypothetical protein